MTGLLLAGGASRRMAVDKATLPFDGEPLAVRVARVLGQVCREILVASGDGERLSWLGVEQVTDAVPGAGPLSGIVAGLERASNPLVAVLAVDMPFASAAVLRLLGALWSGEDAVVPATARGLEPLHAVYRTAAAPMLRARLVSGELGLREALSTLRCRVVGEAEWGTADPTGRFAVNLNRPEDMRAPGAGG